METLSIASTREYTWFDREAISHLVAVLLMCSSHTRANGHQMSRCRGMLFAISLQER